MINNLDNSDIIRKIVKYNKKLSSNNNNKKISVYNSKINIYKNELDKNGYNSDKLFDIIQKGGNIDQLLIEFEKQKKEIIEISNSIDLKNEMDFNDEIDALKKKKKIIIDQYKQAEKSLNEIVELLHTHTSTHNITHNGIDTIITEINGIISNINNFNIYK